MRDDLIEMANNMTDVPGGYEPKPMTDTQNVSQTNDLNGYRRRDDV
jgi:hypothetical protein